MSADTCQALLTNIDFDINPCSNSIDATFLLPNWVSPIDKLSYGCRLVSPEWANKSFSNTVSNFAIYPSFGDPVYVQSDSNNICVNGTGYGDNICHRESFRGDPISCCLNNHDCNPTSNTCWSDTEHKLTCSPEHRNIFNSACEEPMIRYCSGDDVPLRDPSWMRRWNEDGVCLNLLKSKLFYGTSSNDTCNVIIPEGISMGRPCSVAYPVAFNSEGYYWAKTVMNAVFDRYNAMGHTIGSRKFISFEDSIFNNVCCPYSGVCETSLNKMCSVHNVNTLMRNHELNKWCGCFLPIENYERYANEFNVSKECTPVCNNYLNIPLAGVSGTPITCKQNVCIIDGVTINLLNSSAQQISLDQMCNGCSDGVCNCVVTDTEIFLNNTTVNGSVIAATQNCGRVTCQVDNSSGIGPDKITTDCNSDNPIQPAIEKGQREERSNKAFSILIVVVSVFVVLLILYFVFYFVFKK